MNDRSTDPEAPRWRIRSDYVHVHPYKTVKTLEMLSAEYGIPLSHWVKLNQNENSYGPLAEALQSLQDLHLHRYPDSRTQQLCEALGEYCGVPADRIVAGNGGDEVIDVLFRLLIDPGDEVINCPPTFGFYPVAANLNRAELVHVPRDHHFAVDVEAVVQAVTKRTKLILLCNPNNPTANTTPTEDIRRLLEIGLPVLVDEAYVEFSQRSSVPLQDEYPHLMIIRTFSKWAGLAGLRVGYGIFSAELAPTVMAIRPAYTVNGAAQAAALISLQHRGELLRRVDQIRASRDALINELKRLAVLRVWPSESNFIYCTESEACSIASLYAELVKRGILVRLFSEPEAVRITVGTDLENERLMDALHGIERNVSRVTVR